jgi:hypothetical protein
MQVNALLYGYCTREHMDTVLPMYSVCSASYRERSTVEQTALFFVTVKSFVAMQICFHADFGMQLFHSLKSAVAQ